jgi:beta-xylosidase
LAQEKLDLAVELEEMTAHQDIAPLETEFVKVAKSYGERNGITYSAWREIGVDPSILKKAGIDRHS